MTTTLFLLVPVKYKQIKIVRRGHANAKEDWLKHNFDQLIC